MKCSIWAVLILALSAVLSVGCKVVEGVYSSLQDAVSPSEVVRRSGQVELFRISQAGRLTPSLTIDDAPPSQARGLFPKFDDPVQYTDDVITIQVHSAYFHEAPVVGLFSPPSIVDIVLFAEVWENSALGYSSPSLNTIVHVAQNQLVPGRMNFDGNLAYGPTAFKGHPLRVKFTLMILRKRKGEQMATGVGALQDFASYAGPGSFASPLASQAVALIQQILRNRPDVQAFDFEVTFMSHRPERLMQTTMEPRGIRSTSGMPHLYQGAASRSNAFGLPPTDEDTRNRLVKLYQLESNNAFDSFKGAFERWQRISGPLVESSEELIKNIESVEPGEARVRLDDLRDAIEIATYHPRRAQFALQRAKSSLSPTGASSNGASPENSQTAELSTLVDRIDGQIKEANTAHRALERAWNDLFWLYSQLESEVPNKLEHAHAGTQDRINWLRYGFYALVETAPYRSAGKNRKGEGNWINKVRLDGTRLVQDQAHLDATYLVFSITPGQLEQDAAVLAAASALTDDLVRRFREGSADPVGAISAAKKRVKEHEDEMLYLHGVKLAYDLARHWQDHSDRSNMFRKSFAAAWHNVVEQMMKLEQDQDSVSARRKMLHQMGDAISSRWHYRMLRNPLPFAFRGDPLDAKSVEQHVEALRQREALRSIDWDSIESVQTHLQVLKQMPRGGTPQVVVEAPTPQGQDGGTPPARTPPD